MSRTKPKIAAAAVLAFGLLGAGAGLVTRPMRAADAEPEKPPEAGGKLARKITPLQPGAGDLATVLQVYQTGCEIELGAVPERAALGVKLEFYKKGRKADFTLPCPTHQRPGGFPRRIRISLLAVDLDYLPLAGGKKGHYRVHVCENISGRSCGVEDVPKEVFDFSQIRTSSVLSVADGSPTEVPLFFVAAQTGISTDANTVQQVIEDYKEGDLLIAYLRATK
jgi:hypothetical protein